MSDNAASENIISLLKRTLMQYSGMKYYLNWTVFFHVWTWSWTIVINFERKLNVTYSMLNSMFKDPNEKVNDDDKFMTQELINAERQ